MAGRPRGVDDAVILRAAVDVMGRVGPAKLTLALVAREVGLVPGTLVQRFGSKRGLLLALAAHSAADTEQLAADLRAAHDSPLDVLAAFLAALHAPMTTPEAYAHHLAFLCADLADDEFRARALAAEQDHAARVTGLLAEAADAGLLRPGTDPAALAATVRAATTGCGVLWAVDRRGTLLDRLRTTLDAVLAPHLAHPQEDA
ncbi:helix-turn-helix domain-containing protein [Streptomyces sp. NPDC101118]|uniref:TetR/AcrR family transcriptional regulator n=1 Tax=Streptomyces sp. NPDC101118 TaxID=3366109 RepID=UPI00380DC4FE